MKILAAVAVAMALFATNARAQTILNSPISPSINVPVPPLTSSVFAADATVRISTTFRIAVASKDTESMNDAKAQEAARRTLYGMAAGECALLSETFKAECRLNSFTITSLALNLPPTSMMAGTAIDELKPAWQASGR
jgi:hypothetical protein